jgi:regulator of protease activity HflC (stomatin/prohibitin superfamily)
MERLKIAAMDEGEAVKIKQVKNAEAAGETTRIQASAEAEAAYLQGVGMARQRHAILEGMKSDVEEWASVPGMDAQSVVALMLQTQYYGGPLQERSTAAVSA